MTMVQARSRIIPRLSKSSAKTPKVSFQALSSVRSQKLADDIAYPVRSCYSKRSYWLTADSLFVV